MKPVGRLDHVSWEEVRQGEEGPMRVRGEAANGRGFLALLAFIFVIPVVIKAVVKGIALDAKLDPEEGEDETRLEILRRREAAGEMKAVTKRTERSFYRRWLRSANYQKENIERALEGKSVDNCPRLTRAKRNLWKSLKDNHAAAAERKDLWRARGNNLENELALRNARREIASNANYLAQVTIDGIDCERAIIAVDSEGADGDPTTVIIRDGVTWPEHHSILWGASGVGFTKDGRVLNLPPTWIGHDDKRPLTGEEIADFLLSLPERYGMTCYFVGFSINYDITMLLKLLRQERSKDWHYRRVWEICKRQDFETKKVRNNTIFIGKYAISYIKSKVLIIHELDESNNVLRRVTIYDVFGFYQTAFVKVVASLVPLGLATEEEVERMRLNKARRGDFASRDWSLNRIKEYTIEELRKLSAAISVLRKAAFEDGIKMRRLDGAGNLSSGMMRKHKVMKHYKGLMKKYNADEEQLIGYHADFGGRIELIQQGYDKNGICYKYDERSSYPHKCVSMPPMIGGFWVKRGFDEFDWKDIENASPISMFQVQWNLPERYIDKNGNMQVIPFYALPYRIEGGGIRFWSIGCGWYFRDELIFLKRWLETFSALGACINPDGSPSRLSKEEADRLLVDPVTRKAGYLVDLVEARLFYPGGGNERPFDFVPEAFAKRRAILEENERTGQYNIAEKILKISLAGLSGKVAQSIGGSETKPPGCFNVFYAGAIRAGTRRAIGEAALQAPHEIVQFCTDAVFSKVPLTLDEGRELGQWEKEEIRELLTVQSGIYSYKKDNLEEDIENKARGFAVSSVDLEAIEARLAQEGVPEKKRKMLAFREVLLTKTPAAWKQAALNDDGTVNNASTAIDLNLRTFMTAGSAVAGTARFDLIGRWAEVPKKMNVHTPGPKRRLLEPEDCDDDAERVARMYWSVNRDSTRCHELVPTAPARPEGDTWGVMSRPHIPKWYEGEAKLDNDWVMEEDLESEDIALGDR